jgi:HK97 family phage major capsid protein
VKNLKNKESLKELFLRMAEEFEAEDGEEKEVETAKEEAPEVESSVSVDLTKAVDSLGDRIIETLKGATSISDSDSESLKNKLFDTKNGMGGIEYPDDSQLHNMVKTYKTSSDPHAKKEAGDNIIVSFFKAWVGYKDNPEAYRVFKALNEGTAAEGGHLVPAPLADAVWRILPDQTVMRRIARTLPMSSLTLDLNSLTQNPQAYWVSEYAKKTTTSAEFSEAVLTAYKLVCLLPITHELLADANIDLANFIVELFVERIAREEDKAFFTGTGTGQPRGIDTETLSTVTAGAILNFDDVITLINRIPQRPRTSPRAAFVGNNYSIQNLRKVKDSNGNYIWRDPMFVGEVNGIAQPVQTLYGYPFYEQNDIAQKKIFFGDWSYYIIGDRQQITVNKTDEGGDAWRRDATEFKAVERVGGRAVMTTPFAELQY